MVLIIKADFGCYASTLAAITKDKDVTILFNGMQGSCKSSTINSWFKMLRRDVTLSVANAGIHVYLFIF